MIKKKNKVKFIRLVNEYISFKNDKNKLKTNLLILNLYKLNCFI